MKRELAGAQRTAFLENLGRQYSGTGYYKGWEEAFSKVLEFVPFTQFEFGRADWSDFYRGFEEVQDLRNLVMLTKAKAQADNDMILKELEGKGLTFLQERVK